MVSFPPPSSRGRNWLNFLVPVGVSCVVMILGTLVVLNQQPEEIERPGIRTIQRARGFSGNTDQPAQFVQEEGAKHGKEVKRSTARPSPVPSRPKRRRGFSPVAGSADASDSLVSATELSPPSGRLPGKQAQTIVSKLKTITPFIPGMRRRERGEEVLGSAGAPPL